MFGIDEKHYPLISLIAGILGLSALPVVGSVVAILVGRKCKDDPTARAGVVLGWIGIALSVASCCIGALFFAISFATTSTSSFLFPVTSLV